MSKLNIGITDETAREAEQYDGLYLGRISVAHKGIYKAVTEEGEVLAGISGKLRHAANGSIQLPVVGDFVMMDRGCDSGGNAVIHHILPRRSLFTRKAPGTGSGSQAVAANIDTVFICMSMGRDFNQRRLERYLSIAWESGAVPAVVLTKNDLCEDIPGRLAQARAVAPGVDILCVSSLSGDGTAALEPYLQPGKTVALIGSSGVGKSSLINRLMGREALSVRAVRSDEKGRHTTTHRELLILQDGGCVIDTPGMRELGLDCADLDKSFSDIADLAQRCRFGDCSHKNEPGCAVREAIENGLLPEDRLESYDKLQKEIRYQGLDSRQIEEAKLQAMASEIGGKKNMRKFIQEQSRRKGRR